MAQKREDKMLNLFEMAELQLNRENKKISDKLILEYAIKIRKWIDKHRQTAVNKILAGGKVYQYKNRIVII